MINNWFYIIPNLFFGFLLLLAIKRFKNVSSQEKNYLPFFLIFLYFLSSSLIYFIDPVLWYPKFHTNSYSALNFIIYSLFLFLFLFPALYLKPIPRNLNLPRSKFLHFIMITMVVLGIFSFIYQFPYAIQGLIIGAVELRNQMNTEGFQLLPKSPFTTLAVATSYFYLFYIAFFFLAIVQKRHYVIRYGLLIGSLSYIISGLAFTTRDVFVFYALGFLFIYFYFSNLLEQKIQQKIKIIMSILLVSLLFGIYFISAQRFSGESKHDSISEGTIGYVAQQPFVFAETIEQQTKFYEGNLRFPIFKSFYSETKEIKRTKQYEWSFGTFIKDFYAEGGFVFLTVMTLLLVPFFFIKLRYQYKNNFYQRLIISLFYFQFMSMGLFYFKMGNRAGNIYILLLILLYIVAYFRFGQKRGNYA